MDEFLFLMIVFALMIGGGIGAAFADSSTLKDCDKLGQFRAGDKVYSCALNTHIDKEVGK